MDPKDREPTAQLTQTPPPERSEPVRLIAMLAGDNDAVKNQAGQSGLHLTTLRRGAASGGMDVMPTLPMKATPIPPPTASREEYVARALEMIPNTCPFDVTGHPALTVPCGTSSGLPVGMMLIGRHWEDGTVLRAGHAFEQMK